MVRSKGSPTKPDEKLPAIDGGTSRHSSASSNEKKSEEVVAVMDENRGISGKDIMGFLEKCVLSRQEERSGTGCLPALNNSFNKQISRSVPSSRNEQRYNSYNRRFICKKFCNEEGKPPPYPSNLKEHHTDKVIIIEERTEKGVSPRRCKYQCVVSESRFPTVNNFVDELSKVIRIPDRERYIYSARHGNVIRNIDEFEDNGEYIFGSPPHPQSSVDCSTPELSENDLEADEAKKWRRKTSRVSLSGSSKFWSAQREREMGRKKQIMIQIGSYGNNQINFVVDEIRHKTMMDIYRDIPANGQIARLAFRNGRPVTSVNEIFHSSEDVFVAALGNENMRRNSRYAPAVNTCGRPREVNACGKIHFYHPPTDYVDSPQKKSDEPPLESMEIDWVYGYNGRKCTTNLFLMPSIELAYYVAKVVVLFDGNEGKQRYYTGHTGEICCMARHPGRWIIATGQVSEGAKKSFSHILIWDGKTLETKMKLVFEDLDVSVECLAFSQVDNGMKLAAIGHARGDWRLQVWDWEESIVLAKSRTYGTREIGCVFDPLDSNIIITCGESHLFFWDISEENNGLIDGAVEATSAVGHICSCAEVPEYMTCVGFNEENELVSADSNGYVHKWSSEERKTIKSIKTDHEASITAMEILPGDYVVTGGEDRLFSLINFDAADPTLTRCELEEQYGNVVAITPVTHDFSGDDYTEMKFIVGTSKNYIICGSMDDGIEPVVCGPSCELTAIQSHPTENCFITCRTDGRVVSYSAETHKELWNVSIESMCSALDISPDGKTVVIGCYDGRLIVLNAEDGVQQKGEAKAESSRITSITYTPDGDNMAVGMETGSVYFYKCSEDSRHLEYKNSVKLFDDPIISGDWDTSGSYIRFATSEFDYKIWNLDGSYLEERPQFQKDLNYKKESSANHYHTAGIWNNDDEDITFPCCDKSKGNNMFGGGTNSGGVRVYKYPVEASKAPYNEGQAHSSELSGISFLPDDEQIISAGKNDFAIVQWRFVVKKTPEELPQRREDQPASNGCPEDRYPRYGRGNNDSRGWPPQQPYYNQTCQPAYSQQPRYHPSNPSRRDSVYYPNNSYGSNQYNQQHYQYNPNQQYMNRMYQNNMMDNHYNSNSNFYQ